MKIKQVSKLTGLTEKTVRYYESKGFFSPDIHELNGRSFRDYGKEHISVLYAVSVLRKARFTIEQITAMQKQPEQIQKVVSSYLSELDEAISLLTSIKELLDNQNLSSFKSIYDLSSSLELTTKNIPLPTVDVKFNFKRFDSLSAEKLNYVNSRPILSFRFGWYQLYSGHDVNRYLEVKSKLTTAGLKFKVSEYTTTTRLSIQGLANQGVSSPGAGSHSINKGPSVTPYGLQAKMLSDKSMDMYYIEVRKKDAEKAREALRIVN